MSASFDNSFDIFLRTQADLTAIDQTKQKLQELTNQTKESNAAMESFGAAMDTALNFAIGGTVLFLFTQIASGIRDAIELSSQLDEELKKTTSTLEEQASKWIEIAQASQKFGDFSKLAPSLQATLSVMMTQADEFRSTELSKWAKLIDAIAAMWSTIPGMGARPMAEALAGAQRSADDALKLTMEHQNAAIDSQTFEIAEAVRIKAESASDAVKEIGTRVQELQSSADQLERKRYIDPDALTQFISVTQELGRWKGRLDDANERQEKLTNLTKKTGDEIDLINAKLSGDAQKQVEAAGQKAFDAKIAAYKQLGPLTQAEVSDAERARDATEQTTKAQLENKSATQGTADAHQDIVAFLTEESALLHSIRQSNELTQSNPLLFADQKEAAELQSIPQQIEAINAKIQEGKSALAHSALDPQTYAQATKGIQGLEFQAATLGQKLTTLTKPLQTGLVQWVNQFGSTIHQVSNLITSTLTVAVNGVANAITGAIFRTQSWGQAFAQIAQSIIGNLIQIALQWAVSRAVMALLNIAFGKSEAAASNEQAAQSAAACAPAAISASIASYGVAAGAGNIAYIAALISGTSFAGGLAKAGGAFETGGYTGDGGSSQVAGIVHRGEYVMPKSTVDRIGIGNLDRLRSSIDSGGGRGGEAPHFYFFTDKHMLQKHWQNNPASKKQIIDWVNGAGGNLRT
jgi:large-conductance mechanosensitive channel